MTNIFEINSTSSALVVYGTQSSLFFTPDDPIAVDGYNISPWGADNLLPSKIARRLESSEIVSSNLQFNIAAGYGLGVRPLLKVNDANGFVDYRECDDEDVLEFFDNNDIDAYFLEQLTDMLTFFNVFPEITLNEDGSKIVSLRSLEATFSRWGCVESGKGGITKHYLCADWSDTGTYPVIESDVLPRYNTLQELKDIVDSSRKRRFVLQVKMPTPGKTYYSTPAWWSIFKSGWFDIASLIPKQKLALLKNSLAVRYIVYIDDEYWTQLASSRNIQLTDKDAMSQLKSTETSKIIDFLQKQDGKGGGLVTTKKTTLASTGKTLDSRYIDIVTIDSDIESGKLIEDSEEASNTICYAMSVHPSLNGATPGKTSGSLGGSDKRELYMIKQSMMQPFRERLLKPLYLIKKYNGWPDNLVFGVPEYQFPTLDVSKSGKQMSTQSIK